MVFPRTAAVASAIASPRTPAGEEEVILTREIDRHTTTQLARRFFYTRKHDDDDDDDISNEPR